MKVIRNMFCIGLSQSHAFILLYISLLLCMYIIQAYIVF